MLKRKEGEIGRERVRVREREKEGVGDWGKKRQ